MKWLSFTRKENTQSLLAAPEAAPYDHALRARFSQAAYGAFFRTRAYKPPVLAEIDSDTDRVWREATYVPDFGWLLRNVYRYRGPDGAVWDKSARINPDRGVDFFEAVKSLSIFENTTDSHSGVEAEPDEVKQLGHTHLRAFAEREGLVFDVNGVPHVTANGFIVTDGVFPSDTQARANLAEQERKKSLADLPSLALPRMTNDKGDDIRFVHTTHMRAAVKILYRLMEIGKIEYSWRWADCQYYRDLHKEELRRDIAFTKFYQAFEPNYKAEIKKSFAALGEEVSPLATQFYKAFALVKLYGLVSQINYFQRKTDDGRAKDNLAIKKRVPSLLKDVQVALNDLGMGHMSAQAVVFRLDNSESTYSKELEEIRFWVQDVTSRIRKDWTLDAPDSLPTTSSRPLPKLTKF